jgi:hypothetical protein
MNINYGPEAATRADAARATIQTAAVNADPAASGADREAAAEREMAAYESFWHANGIPAYAAGGARQGLVREHAGHGHAQIAAVQQAERGDFEAGS